MSEDALRQLASDGRMWASMGTVKAIETHAAWGLLLTVETEPDGCECQARLQRIGAGNLSGGQFWPVSVGDEVLVIFARGNPNAGIALHGFTSRAAPEPAYVAEVPEKVHLQNLEGFRFTTGNTTPGRLVREEFLGALKDSLTELMGGVNSGAPTPTPSTITFLSQLNAGAFLTAALESE